MNIIVGLFIAGPQGYENAGKHLYNMKVGEKIDG